jgi:hypothetical protein
MLLPSSEPHHEVRIKGLGGGVELLPMVRVGHRGILGELVWTLALVYASGLSSRL